MLRIVEQAAIANSLPRIRKVVLEIGQFSGVEVHALESAFSAFRQGTVLEGVEIEYQTPPLFLFCKDCQTEYVGDAQDLRCPACEGDHYQILHGRELIVKSIVVAE